MSCAANEYIAKRLKINGIVQGVGFRPFVFKLANRFNLKGEIANTSHGVSIVIEGECESINLFLKDLIEKTPLLAKITDIDAGPEKVQGHKDFSIAKSEGYDESRSVLISPDVSVCDDCLKELDEPEDRKIHNNRRHTL